ncbi:MAG: hypothetical protein QNJ75_13615 [Acidimicrobiia bacterium]|nr:hypothetical protein [Acidimicrobiia bacterium]
MKWIARLFSLQISAGVLDAGLASLATFVAGLVAVNVLSAAETGVYAVFFTAFTLGQVIATNLTFVPAEVVAVAWPRETRLAALRQTLRLGSGPSLLGTLAIAVASVVAIPIGTGATIGPLAATSAVTVLLWPMQIHIRRLLHIAEESWSAVAVSATQLVGVITSIVAMRIIDITAVWIPFGSLALATFASLTTGILLARRSDRSEAPEQLQLRALIRSGAGLLAGVGIPAVTKFGAATIIGYLAGAEVLGYAEAARVVANPVLVLGTGLSFVLGPRAMKAAVDRNRDAANRARLRFIALIGVAAVAYLAIVGPMWVGNPMTRLVPRAYEVSWLVAASIGANLLMGILTLVIQEMTAARRTNLIAIIGLISAPFQLAAAATAGATGAFARPLSWAAGSLVRFAGYAPALRNWYATGSDSSAKAVDKPVR